MSSPETLVPRLIATKRLDDARGWFTESYNERRFAEAGIRCAFVQDNHSLSRRKGTIRGLHFQAPPMAQAKLVRVVRGRIFDVAVDIRVGSPTYGSFVAAELSANDGLQLFIPVGFAHGFCTLERDTEIIYKVSDFYGPDCERGIRFDDPDINISWPAKSDGVELSEKDARLPFLAAITSPFAYAGVPLGPLGPPV